MLPAPFEFRSIIAFAALNLSEFRHQFPSAAIEIVLNSTVLAQNAVAFNALRSVLTR
jgi:hypothetical protein